MNDMLRHNPAVALWKILFVLAYLNGINAKVIRLNQNLKLSGVIITKYERNKLSDMYVQKVKDELGDVFIEPLITKATKIAQAGSFCQSIYDYDPSGKVTKQYAELANNLLQRML